MAYSRERAAPDPNAHRAAAALDRLYEAAKDGIHWDDLRLFRQIGEIRHLFNYIMGSGISRGEMISRTLQVLSLVERDNAIIRGQDEESS